MLSTRFDDDDDDLAYIDLAILYFITEFHYRTIYFVG